MITTYISGNELIGRVDHELSIESSDWVTKAPLWIADCLAELDILDALQPVKVSMNIVDYQCTVPINLVLLDRVTINGIPLTPHKAVNAKWSEDVTVIDHATRYSVRPDSDSLHTIMEFGVETGIATFYYNIPAVEPINEFNVVMPKVPNNIHVINCVKWFIMIKLLQRGFVHPVFNLKENNKFTNPALAWEEEQYKARNSVSTMDQSERRVISEMTREFIKNYDYFYNEGYLAPITASSNSANLIIEYATFSLFPTIGVSGITYLDLDTNISYVWLGLTYQPV